jgi:hypothetical protein
MVLLGGIPSLEKTSIPVRPDGTFAFTIELPPNTVGIATAHIRDWRAVMPTESRVIVDWRSEQAALALTR